MGAHTERYRWTCEPLRAPPLADTRYETAAPISCTHQAGSRNNGW